MKYDFTSITERSGRDAIAVDMLPVKNSIVKEGFSRIPMWVADMSFPTAPSVQKALADRISHPFFGYFVPQKEYYQAVIRWHERRYGTTGLSPACIGYENGVLGGVMSALGVFCSRGDKVLVHSPTYIGFTHSLENAGYHIISSPLIQDDGGTRRMDYQDMEEKIKKHHIHAALLCSPHNPSGRVWRREELEQAMDLFSRYDVQVVADEIWADIIVGNNRHIPAQMVSQDARMRTVALYAPSKTFNLAGLVGSYHVIYNPQIRDRIRKESSLAHYNSMNVLSMHALIGAYSEPGAEWVDELCQVLSDNVDYALSFIGRHFPGVTVTRPEGTYLLFLDCSRWCQEHKMSLDDLLKAGIAVGVLWQDGRPFHGKCHIRMNLALPKALVEEAFERLRKYVFCMPD
ncbi:MAG: aminotransferase class I/II-fold pyridoxal phosphate-dependent enzyme [Eubacterium sp.]|nr:aminotransferase class I/II-fold pyridoxal phosphate-dependent enzyme [Eubacterium sp.]